MGGEARDIKEAIRALSGMDDLMYEATVCQVSDVNITDFTCTCSPIDGSADLFDVLLNANASKGFVLVPKDKSIVVVNQISEANAYVSMVSDVDQVYIAGDVNGGLVNVQPLSTALNTLQTEINTLKTLTGTAIAVYSGYLDSGASAATFNAAVLPQIDISQIENTKVKHGNG